jgi:hypothetical protein
MICINATGVVKIAIVEGLKPVVNMTGQYAIKLAQMLSKEVE